MTTCFSKQNIRTKIIKKKTTKINDLLLKITKFFLVVRTKRKKDNNNIANNSCHRSTSDAKRLNHEKV